MSSVRPSSPPLPMVIKFWRVSTWKHSSPKWVSSSGPSHDFHGEDSTRLPPVSHSHQYRFVICCNMQYTHVVRMFSKVFSLHSRVEGPLLTSKTLAPGRARAEGQFWAMGTRVVGFSETTRRANDIIKDLITSSGKYMIRG